MFMSNTTISTAIEKKSEVHGVRKWKVFFENVTVAKLLDIRPISKNFTVTSRNAIIWVINHVDIFWTFLTPSPHLWTILLNKAYVVTYTFG